jgi:hypothetical protein
MSTNNGGPAFPVIGAPGAPEDFPGMTLRDYFAAKAMEAGLTRGLPGGGDFDILADASYKAADAMLKARAA